jgi:hypothetical protein
MSAAYGQFDEAEPQAVRDGGGTSERHRYERQRSFSSSIQRRLTPVGHWQARFQPRSNSNDNTNRSMHGIGNRLRNLKDRLQIWPSIYVASGAKYD